MGVDTAAVLPDKRFIPDAGNLAGNTDSFDDVFNTICKDSVVLLVEEKDCPFLIIST